MNEIMPSILVWIALAGLAGGVLGLLYFSGLWWTIQLGVSSRHPGLLFVTSFLLRSFIVLCGFYFVAGNHWERMVACLLGFTLVRYIVVQRTNLQAAHSEINETTTPVKEANHAPES